MLLQRNLIYTGITRGKNLVVLIGQRKALRIAVSNNKTQRRYSGLLEALTSAVPPSLSGPLDALSRETRPSEISFRRPITPAAPHDSPLLPDRRAISTASASSPNPVFQKVMDGYAVTQALSLC